MTMPPLSFNMFLHSASADVISKSILEKQHWEGSYASRLIRAMARMREVNPSEDSWFLDIGANIGYFSMSVGNAGNKVAAFEPTQFNMELLAASSAEMQGGGEIRLYKSAVASRHSEPLCMMPGGDNNIGNMHVEPAEVCSNEKLSDYGAELVSVETVDSILAADPVVSGQCFGVIKIDVEGFETEALNGAMSVIQSPCAPCYILLEYGEQPGLFELLVVKLGYRCEGIVGKDSGKMPPLAIAPFDAGSGTRSMDYECRRDEDPRCAHELGRNPSTHHLDA
jgi:FkbM family methyltransferase